MFKIIVPTDFTPTSEKAIEYAFSLSKTLDAEVHLLHIIKSDAEENEAKNKLAGFIDHWKVKTGHVPMAMLKKGNIFEDIPSVVEEEKGDLVVMGTHGLKGLQYIVGSHALRVITETKAPFVVVQDGTMVKDAIHKILVPLDLHKETKQKIRFAGDMAEKFKSEVQIIVPKEDDEYLQNALMRNLSYAEGYFESREIAYQTVVAGVKSSHFAEAVAEHAEKAGIDLICILNFANEKMIHAFGVDAEQKIITNKAGIPVMVLNPVVANLHNTRSLIGQWG
jgi:nucleotide-binding universal stress UspA family protein